VHTVCPRAVIMAAVARSKMAIRICCAGINKQIKK
jgi:hypothetical protein